MIESVSLPVTGMKCGGCESNVTNKLKAIDGVIGIKASSKDNEINIEFDNETTSLEMIKDVIVEAGFTLVE
ncbi:MAG: heavy-metal-associated domain-containing protein [Methylococcaceae bacterium]